MPARLLNTSLKLPRNPGARLRLGKAYGAGAGLTVAELAARAQESERCTLVLTADVATAESLATEIDFFSDADAPFLFPDLETLSYDAFSPHQDLISSRLRILRDLPAGRCATLIVAAPSLLPRLPPTTYLRDRGLSIAVGQRLTQDEFREQLDDAGYQRVSQVGLHGDYAVRGSLIDFFPTGHDTPLRIDFFDDEVESLREFDPDSQITTARINAVDTLPAREIPIDETAVTDFRRRYRQRFEGNPSRSLIYREVTERRLPGGVENYLPLFFEDTASLWDYLPANTLLVCYGDIEASLAAAWQQTAERFEQLRHDAERPALDPNELFWSPEIHAEQLATHAAINIDAFEIPDELLADDTLNLNLTNAPGMLINRRDAEPSARLRALLEDPPARILFAAESAGRRELLMDILRQEHASPASVPDWSAFIASEARTCVTVAPLNKGAILSAPDIAIITEFELFGDKPKRRRRHRRVQDPGALISDLTDLRAGAPVVHTEHGIGRYIGLTNLDIGDMPTEFVTLEYAGGDKLHVPVASLHLISRYTGAAPDQAPLHRLGSDQWAKTTRKAAEKIRDVAAELLELYSKRAARDGFACKVDGADLERFADAFPFEPTEDQAKAIEEVIGDLVEANPMDRLVCGDVGFGKTEVALRAAFVSVSNDRQVAVLVPTTLLAQQHHQTFVDRFADWPINVAILSRFQTQKESRETLEALKAGKVDIIIGTHRLLQRNVEFKDLGLVVIDEEHRFGVRHKERLKTLRNEVDILMLTATPIPRTLNMALGSLRELSLITTPPESRLAIKTFVTKWNDALIREACQRELKRGGQIYFVHNRIEDIERIAQQVEALVPEAGVEVAHGQMRERDLERIMNDFYHRRFHILICTAIIESGLDVPSANTIIINRADRFGLAQLHQLRGRVGRSHHQAFAYLLTPAREALTADAEKRLAAIESLEDLGAGFVLATHDLEIRGAGELLGEGQTGQIHEIGFSLYNEMLTRTVQALRDGLEPDLEIGSQAGPEINLHVPALLPDDYLPDVHLRLVHYKRIASAPDKQQLDALQVELIDRFGLLPEPTRNLFRVTELRLLAAPLGIRRVEISGRGGLVEFGTHTSVDPLILVQLLESEPHRFRLDRQQRLKIMEDLAAEDRFEFVATLLRQLAAGANSDNAA
jgi:transcription-repair coupling factor (superfamily II helicase)